MKPTNKCDGRHKPMNKQLQNYLILNWLSTVYNFVEDIDIDSSLRLPENWENTKNGWKNYI